MPQARFLSFFSEKRYSFQVLFRTGRIFPTADILGSCCAWIRIHRGRLRMTAGFLTATCLYFVLSQGASEVWYTNRRDPEIPVKIDAERREEIRELLLYTCTEQDRNWVHAGTITPDKGKFVFYAAKDATYWL